MRLVGGWIFVTALAVAIAPVASAGPLESGRPAGVRQAQDRTTSILAFSGGIVALAGAGFAFSRMLNGSTDGTTARITGGGVFNPTVIVTTTTTTTG